ncbi:LacI family transcriptional regulator [Dactylosporangium sp. NBC_01737]|uniref:LacI family DNA-binding transcriptional regulator n=1 Tax=Dactylosporangium sp. NBC_01737 TaxID=2975959 RepID=UPI002E0FC841|nr:LacI family transcriptional regulator [Dactylosporangium sp. NBC_01737]
MQHKRPTLDDVAQVAGFSRATVSRVINGNARVAAEVRDQVQRAVEQLGYRPDPVARALARGHGDVVELIVVDGRPTSFGTNPYYGRVVAGVVDGLRHSEAQMRVHVVGLPDAPRLLDRVAHSVSVGAILVNVPPPLAAAFHAICPRVVSMGRTAAPVPSIVPDNTTGAYEAVRLLHRNGRKRIAAVTGPAHISDAVDRRAGYLAAVRDAGLDPITGDGGEFTRETGATSTRRLLDEHPDLDALFVACDLMASGALQTLAAAGRRVPQDVAVIAFDDSLIAACTTPPLTSVRQPVEEMAAAATRALLAGEVGSGWHATFPTTLTVRDSSG